MEISILKKLNLNDKEINIYLKLLEYGPLSIRNLAELANLNRGTTYEILKKLQEKNLINFYRKDKHQKFVAEDPRNLIKLVEQKEKEIKIAKEKVNHLIPLLKSIQNKSDNKPISKFYEGKNGIKIILEDLLDTVTNKEAQEYFVYSATKGSDDVIKAYPNFTKDRIKRGIKVKAISLAQGGNLNGLDERRWLGTNQGSATYILIYAGKCAFISRDLNEQPVGIIIENQNIYETQKTIFLELWKKL